MKKLFLVVFLILSFVNPVNSQTMRMFTYTGNPSGGCQYGYFAQNTTTGQLFYCKQSAWASIGVSSGIITGAGTSGQLAFYSAGAVITGDTDLTFATDTLTGTKINATTGFQLGAAAPSNHILLGNGTNYVDATLLPIAAGGTNAATFAARSVFGNATAGVAAPTVTTTVNALAYQTAEIPSVVFVPGDFTTSGVGTALEAITGLTWTMPANTPINLPFYCSLIYHQNTATATINFGTQNATTAPTNYAATGVMYSSLTALASAGQVVGNTATTAVAVVSGTPGAITTDKDVFLSGLIEQPSGAASVFTIRVSTATAADTVTVKRGSYCKVG